MTWFRTRIIPPVLAAVLFTLGGCGLFFEEGPTDATLATMNALQAITEAIAVAVLPGDVSGTALPYGTGGGAAGEGEFAAFGGMLVQSLAGSQPLATVPFLGDTPSPCPVSGSVTLTGSAEVVDGRDPGTGWGTITIAFGSMLSDALQCEGYNHRSSGSISAGANDTITIADSGVANHDRWTVARNESASGTLTVTRVNTGATHYVSVNWQRVGSLGLDVERPTSAVTLLGQSQTVYLTVNGQSCTGVYTGRLISPYNWDCN